MKKAITIRDISKFYGSFQAIKNISFDIYDNEFFTLLGPSGCGKTTLLRMIAGFEAPTSGQITLHGKDIQNLPAHKRRVNTVFQSYALFPHMTLEQNIGFGLEMLNWDKEKSADRVNEMLKLVHMEQFAKRLPSQLSGGQRQRIALARALAPEPEVLLLDEPLSALDLKLRQKMRDELQDLQRQTGITFIFVTHDQEEALAMSDRICVLAEGNAQQIDTPVNVYEAPPNRFVADFIGETNFLNVDIIESTDQLTRIKTPLGVELEAPASNVKVGDDAVMSLRPEKISINSPENEVSFPAEVAHRSYLGGFTHYTVKLNSDLSVKVSQRNSISDDVKYNIGETVNIGFSPRSVRVLGQ